MKMTRHQLDVMLRELEAWMPKMLRETEEASQMDVFAGRARMIEESAAEEDRSYVRDRLQRMLRDACLVPDEESPCDDDGA